MAVKNEINDYGLLLLQNNKPKVVSVVRRPDGKCVYVYSDGSTRVAPNN